MCTKYTLVYNVGSLLKEDYTFYGSCLGKQTIFHWVNKVREACVVVCKARYYLIHIKKSICIFYHHSSRIEQVSAVGYCPLILVTIIGIKTKTLS